MGQKNLIIGITLVIMLAAGNVMAEAPLPQNDIATQLGWIAEPNNNHNVCQGYYRELPIAYTPNPLVSAQQNNYNISADQTIYSLKGMSTLKGRVQVTQPDSQLNSDIAYLYPNQETGEVGRIHAVGDVRLFQPGKLVIADTGDLETDKHEMKLYHVHYRIALGQNKTEIVKNPKTGLDESHLYQLNARGEAEEVEQTHPNVLTLKSTTYTTCTPHCGDWMMKASRVNLNHDTGRGYALNSRLFIKKVPVFYMPYFNFPIDNRRQTGFLVPQVGHSTDSGYTLKTPFYWNIAPNYDATISPLYMSERGVQWSGLGRYLTSRDEGKLGLSYLPSDSAFSDFQKTALKDYAGKPNLDRLESASDNRKSVTWSDDAQLTNRWTSHVDYNYVSDDYYIQDFSTDIMDASNSQLTRQANVNYTGDNWNFLGNLQAYQTLHTISADVANQYAKLPQFQLNGDYPVHGDFPYQWMNLDYGVNTEFVDFQKHISPGDLAAPTIGKRFSEKPILRFPLQLPYAFLTPEAKLQLTQYHLYQVSSTLPDNESLAVPIFDVKGGLYFDRETELFKQAYRQTLEPLLYYLYVPYHSQHDFPVFDTNEQTFSYDFMFQDNRFVGVDRIGDDNRMTLALMSRLIDDDTGEERATLGVGQIRYFADRRVTTHYGPDRGVISDSDLNAVSPVTGMATYNVNTNWSLNAGAAWNTYQENFDNDNVGVTYKRDPYHLVNLSYSFVRGGDKLQGAPGDSPKNDLQQTDLSTSWQLTNRWSVMGRWNYNWSHEYAQAYFYGITYDSCCWAVRFLSGRTFKGPDPDNAGLKNYDDYRYLYKSVYYLQVALKGLGNVGTGDTSSFIANSIKNYVDQFGEVDAL
jgi:LPS-assembly protein